MFVVLAIIVVLALLPVAAALGAYAVADANGCTLNEAGVNPCVVLGVDIGEELMVLGVMGWLGLMSLPLGAAGVLAWLVVAAVLYLRGRARGNPT